ncbi:MAG: hypothetical protein H7Y15_11295 [Pseudonocardia sp.]|nr:hypothetical protein [Pseudonocardia sp.]
MTNSTFDGSTTGTAEARPWSPTEIIPPESDAEQRQVAHDAIPLDSLLDQLRDEVTQRDEAIALPWRHRIRGTNFSLVCDPDIDNEDYQRWVKASMPKTKNRRRTPGVADMDQLALSSRAIVSANIGLDVLVRDTEDTWRSITAPGSDEPLTIDSPELLATFNVMDPIALLRKLFGRDAALVDAGQELLSAAGYMGDEDDDEDPTVPVRSAGRVKRT